MKESIAERHSGADNAGSWMVLEEGAAAKKWANTASEGQYLENRNHQIEEVGRAFGVPRALMMMDDTSWGTGMEQLGIFFIQYGLQHWFTAWEEAIKRVLLSAEERDRYHVKFNERALLRGTLKDQGDYLAKASGSGGHAPWMSQNEVREVLDLPESDSPGTSDVRPPSSQKETTNEPPKTA
jgi:HK97 family phage portal protein